MGAERQQVLASKAAKDEELARLKKVESSVALRAKREQELARQLAESRVGAKHPRATNPSSSGARRPVWFALE